MLFGLFFFIPANSQVKLAQQLKTMMLLFLHLYFSWWMANTVTGSNYMFQHKTFKIFDLKSPQLRLPWYSTAATFIRGGAINLKRRPASNWGWVDPDRIEHIGDCHIKSFNGLRGWTTVRAAAPSMALLPSLIVFDSCLEILLLILLIFPEFSIQ